MRKGRDGEKKKNGKNGRKKKREKEKKIRMKIVATTSLPAVDRPNADRWNAARSRQYFDHRLSISILVDLSLFVRSLCPPSPCMSSLSMKYGWIGMPMLILCNHVVISFLFQKISASALDVILLSICKYCSLSLDIYLNVITI